MSYAGKVPTMRFRTAGTLHLAGGLVLLWTSWTGCSGPQDAPPRAPAPLDEWRSVPRGAFPMVRSLGPVCARDADCLSGFCDRGHCGNLFTAGDYGMGCVPPPPRGLYPMCGSYLCLEDRCRSCQSVAECDYWRGPAMMCSAYGRTFGKYCGGDPSLPFSRDFPPPSVPDAGVFPTVASGPPLPEEERRTFDSPCSRDSDCRSGFCDRGICIDLYSKGNYGRECDPGLPPLPDEPDFTPPSNFTKVTPFENRCMGYLCVDRRCSSCESDAECQDKPNYSKCLVYAEWPGKRCGNVVDVFPPWYPVTILIPPGDGGVRYPTVKPEGFILLHDPHDPGDGGVPFNQYQPSPSP
jgi:hypothetical protein